ncbi:MAG: sulfite reductase [Monoraphidium minutum]|nr:MAG: sulfite reductase [Monoraphidium minutum]
MAPRERSLWWWAGCAAAGAYTVYALRPKRTGAADDTDFAGFLCDPQSLAAAQAAAPRARRGAAPPRDDTNFDSFLRVQPAATAADPTGFDSFLRVAPAAGGGAQSAPAAAPKAVEEIPLERAGVLVMYGTEYGFAKEIADKLVAQLKAPGGGFWPTLVNMADHPGGYPLSKEQAVLMVCSTQGDGVPPTEAREFCDWLTAGGAGPLPDLPYAVLALGDTSYPHFCRCGKQLDAALGGAGGAPLAGRVDVDKEDWGAVDGWLAGVAGALPGLGLRSLSETGLSGAGAAAEGAAAPGRRYSKARPYYARVAAVEGLCTITDKAADKETVRVALDLGDSGLAYAPGDALGIYPTNDAAAVSELLAALGAGGDELVAAPAWHYQEAEGHAAVVAGPSGPALPLRAALARCYDLRSPRGDALLKLLQAAAAAAAGGKAAAANGTTANGIPNGTANGTAANGTANGAAAGKQPSAAAQAARAGELLADKAALESYLAPRHVIDVLRDFPAARVDYQQLLPALRQLQPRLYSISSSPLEAPCSVQATIAVVRYDALGAPRLGVCSTFVGERAQVGDVAPVFISKNPDFRLPPSPATPLIMVGPGTGLAPFRAFILHRLLDAGLDPAALGAGQQQQQQTTTTQQQQQQQQQQQGGGAGGYPFGPMALYFGCRRRDQDYLYGSDLERWAAAGAVELHTAFSRQPGAPKVYVQQRLAESGARVWELLQRGGHFYVCGDASSMAGAVEEALLGIIAEHGGGGRPAAEAYLARLVAEHRYERDVWFG